MDRKSKSLISKVRSKLEEMLLYNITIVIYSIAGQTKESLLELVKKKKKKKRSIIHWCSLTCIILQC